MLLLNSMNIQNTNLGIFIWRFNMGALMLMHGIYKLFNGLSYIEGLFANLKLPEILAYGVYLGEVVAPILLLIGFRTRFAAIVFALTMVVAILMSHMHQLASLGKSGAWAIELNALFLLGALGLVFTGGGKYAISSENKWD